MAPLHTAILSRRGFFRQFLNTVRDKIMGGEKGDCGAPKGEERALHYGT